MDALDQLKRNKGNPSGELRQIINNRHSKFADIKPILESIESDALNVRVQSKPAHLIKYISLINDITKRRSHCEHLSSSQWISLVTVLFGAYEQFRDENRSIESVKYLSEVFQSLSSLMDYPQVADRGCFAQIILICEDFQNLFGGKETSCHPYIMKIVRILTSLHIPEIIPLGNSIIEQGINRNHQLNFEIFTFSCMVPQNIDVLLDMCPTFSIESREVEFISSIDFDTHYFRPSVQADLNKFIIMRALAVATKSNSAEAYSEPTQVKKRKLSDNTTKYLRVYAFQENPVAELDDILQFLSEGNVSCQNGRSRRDTVFWGLVVLGQHVEKMERHIIFRAWELASEYLQDANSSSAACFCISRCIACLTSIDMFDLDVLAKLNILLTLLRSSSYPSLTSGSVSLFQALHDVRILDDPFNELKISSLQSWVSKQRISSETQLLSSLFSEECPIIYYQLDLADILSEAVKFFEEEHAVMSYNPKYEYTSIVFKERKCSSPMSKKIACTPDPDKLMDYVWIISIKASMNDRTDIPSPAKKFEAFNDDDIRGFCWFATLACYYYWDNIFIDAFKNLAEWTSVIHQNYQILAAYEALIHSKSPVVKAALLNPYISWNEFGSLSGSDLRNLQSFLQGYIYQRSGKFLQNMAIILQLPQFSSSNEGIQLLRFLEHIVAGYSQWSFLRVLLCLNPSVSESTCAKLMHSIDDWLCIRLASSRNMSQREDFDQDHANNMISSFSDQRLRLYGCVMLVKSQSVSVCDVVNSIGSSVEDIIRPLSSIVQVSELDLLTLVSFPILLQSNGDTERHLKSETMLLNLGVPQSVIASNISVLDSFNITDMERDPRKLIGIIEYIFKATSSSINDYEKIKLAEKSYYFLQAGSNIIPQDILCTFIYNVCAFVGPSKNDSFFDKNLGRLISDSLNGYREGTVFCRIASALTTAGLHGCSREILNKAPSCPLVTSFKNLRKLDFKAVIRTAQLLVDLRNPDCKYELWYAFLYYAVESANTKLHVSAQEMTDMLFAVDIPVKREIVNWSYKFIFPRDTAWMALIGRLIADDRKLSDETKKYEDFHDSLLRVYSDLPYYKKWHLNPFFGRNAILRDHILPLEVLDSSKWDDEASRRLHIGNYSKDEKMYQKFANSLLNQSLIALGLPYMGNYIVEEIPEIARDVLPCLISWYEKVKCTGKVSHKLDDIMHEGVISPFVKIKQLILSVAYRCFHDGYLNSFDLENLTQASHEIILAGPGTAVNTNALYVGIMAIELIWNSNPSTAIQANTEKVLRTFYSCLTDDEYRDALVKSLAVNRSIRSITDEIGLSSIWQRLNVGLERNEVYNCKPDVLFQQNLEEAGLWKISNQTRNSKSKFYDFEKIWWLQEWETIDERVLSQSDAELQSFENTKFAPLISYLLRFTDEDRVFASLARLNDSKFAKCFSLIIKDKRDISTSLDKDSQAVVRQGREILYSATHYDPVKLAFELVESCKELREAGDSSLSVREALKLEKLSTRNLTSHPDIKNLSLMQSAEAQWELGNERVAISSLKYLLEIQAENSKSSLLESPSSQGLTPDDSEVICTTHSSEEVSSPMIVNPGLIYSRLGTWSRLARDESDADIMQNYYEKAESCVTHDGAGEVYHAYAKFCDDALNESDLKTSIDDARSLCDNTEKQLDYIKRAIMGANSVDIAQNRYSQTKKLLESQIQNMNDLMQHQSLLTTRCVQNYLLSILSCDSFESDAGRFVALWLENCDSEPVNAVIRLYLSGEFSQRSTNESMSGFINIQKPVFKFIPWMNQLTSRLDSTGFKPFQEILHGIIFKACLDHPHHSIWQLTNIVKTKLDSTHTARMRSRQSAAKSILKMFQKSRPGLLEKLMTFGGRISELGFLKVSGSELQFKELGSRLSKWWLETLPTLKLPVPTSSIPAREDCDYISIPTISIVGKEIIVAGGLSKPKIIKLIDSTGESNFMLLKGSKRDDLRQDAIMEQVFHLTNSILKFSKKTKNIRIRTYNVVPYGATSGAIEFVCHTSSLKEIVEPLHEKYGGPQEYSMRKARHLLNQKVTSPKPKRIEVYKDIEKHTLPQMRHYWPQRFHDPCEWFAAKNAWSSSCAVMSIVGYILGLGDRHCSNLLIDTNTGEVVHIDLGIAFDQGKLLSVPELVPFRLTRDMVDGMGINGTSGVFSYVAERTLEIMRDQRDRIITVLEVLKHDALYSWRLPKVKLQSIQQDEDNVYEDESPELEGGQADHALNGVRAKLQGTLSCEAEVRDLVAQAQDVKNLALMFQGWSAFY